MSDTFDKLLVSRPVNSAAARVIGGGFSFVSNKKITVDHWTAPPECKPVPASALSNPEFCDLTGRKYGRFTVIGFLGAAKKNSVSRWLVRCACGDFEPRSAKAIRNASEHDRCANCQQIVFLQRRDRYLRGLPEAS